MDPADRLTAGVLAGELRTVARAISLVENRDPQATSLVDRLYPHTGRAVLIGVTGSPGSGKSTLVDRLIAREREAGRTVAVIAVDPSSPFTGGAILGDRLRMQDHAADPGVFIRSMASRGSLGGLTAAAGDAVRVLDAAGYDTVLIETIGVGQTEIDVVELADLVLLVFMPGAGDEIQALKAGVMEIGDIYVINKDDLPGAKKLRLEVEYVLSLGGSGARGSGTASGTVSVGRPAESPSAQDAGPVPNPARRGEPHPPGPKPAPRDEPHPPAANSARRGEPHPLAPDPGPAANEHPGPPPDSPPHPDPATHTYLPAPPDPAPRVLTTDALHDRGVDELCAAIAHRLASDRADGSFETGRRRRIELQLKAIMRARLHDVMDARLEFSRQLPDWVDRIWRNETGPYELVERQVERLLDGVTAGASDTAAGRPDKNDEEDP